MLLGLKEKADDGSKEASPALVWYETLFLIGATLAFWVAQCFLAWDCLLLAGRTASLLRSGPRHWSNQKHPRISQWPRVHGVVPVENHFTSLSVSWNPSQSPWRGQSPVILSHSHLPEFTLNMCEYKINICLPSRFKLYEGGYTFQVLVPDQPPSGEFPESLPQILF